jgi:hypothetical protein
MIETELAVQHGKGYVRWLWVDNGEGREVIRQNKQRIVHDHGNGFTIVPQLLIVSFMQKSLIRPLVTTLSTTETLLTRPRPILHYLYHQLLR